MCHLSHVTSHLSHCTCHLTTTIQSFICYESPRRFGDAASGGLVIDRVKIHLFCQKNKLGYLRKNLFN